MGMREREKRRAGRGEGHGREILMSEANVILGFILELGSEYPVITLQTPLTHLLLVRLLSRYQVCRAGVESAANTPRRAPCPEMCSSMDSPTETKTGANIGKMGTH